jgi:hypothetical protein
LYAAARRTARIYQGGIQEAGTRISKNAAASYKKALHHLSGAAVFAGKAMESFRPPVPVFWFLFNCLV